MTVPHYALVWYSLNDSIVGSFLHLHHLGFQRTLPNLGKPLSYAHPQLFNAMVEQERLEDDGIGDELMEMQEILWPIKRLQANDFAIDMLFEYEDDDGSTLVWCQGRVVAFIKESIDKHVYVKIEWSDKCVRDGDLKITRNQLKKTKWNPNVPVGGAWREDLYHKLMHKG